ncbi:hypothetical protein [Sphingomonas quercus]|uniref:Uncharacterized protein n=1 Tax=Sphingomonas quercus TaxID=2842451 RepID=A0ABS6BH96_9SPHN|nr:hypothetical protein [Sphingomonas quercus]MBU3077675.1 hypothetical protein [Sphingomonas quercus]
MPAEQGADVPPAGGFVAIAVDVRQYSITTGVAPNEETFRKAIEESGTALLEAGTELAQATAGAATGIERASTAFASCGYTPTAR